MALNSAVSDAPTGARREIYSRMLSADGHDNLEAFLHDAASVFDGVQIANRTVLEIGSGRGLMTMYAAMQGAAHVVSMEPEMIGSRAGMIDLQRRRLAELEIDTVEFLPADFNDWDPAGRSFDIVLSRASINHLYASDRHALHDPATYRGYVAVAEKMYQVTAAGGSVLITDACRYAFFTTLRNTGIRRPWSWGRTGINWRHHQNPQTWTQIFRAAGFSRVEVRYPLPFRLRALKGIVDTALGNFFLQGSFFLRAVR